MKVRGWRLKNEKIEVKGVRSEAKLLKREFASILKPPASNEVCHEDRCPFRYPFKGTPFRV